MNLGSSQTAFYRLARGRAREEAIARTAEILRAGGVVVLPTDTVYGLACLASDAAAKKRIAQMKRQPEEKPLQILPGSIEAALEEAEEPSRVAQKLMRVFWPGPLTLVLPAPGGQMVGLRVPEHPDTRAIIREAGGPLAATSANRHGQPPVANAEEALDKFEGEVDAVLDGGGNRPGSSSSVVRIDDSEIDVLREEALSEEEIRYAAQYSVVFAPQPDGVQAFIAAAIARHMLAGLGADVRVAVAVRDADALAHCWTTGVEEVLGEMGYPIEPPETVQQSAIVYDRADAIYLMEPSAERDLARLMPEAEPRLRVLDLTSGEGALPPVGGVGIGLGYRATAVSVEKALWEPCKRIAESIGPPTA